MKNEKQYDSVTFDVSHPEQTDAIHSVALGKDEDYRAMSKVKALVDCAFNEVCKGKVNPKAALVALRDELKCIFVRY